MWLPFSPIFNCICVFVSECACMCYVVYNWADRRNGKWSWLNFITPSEHIGIFSKTTAEYNPMRARGRTTTRFSMTLKAVFQNAEVIMFFALNDSSPRNKVREDRGSPRRDESTILCVWHELLATRRTKWVDSFSSLLVLLRCVIFTLQWIRQMACHSLRCAIVWHMRTKRPREPKMCPALYVDNSFHF